MYYNAYNPHTGLILYTSLVSERAALVMAANGECLIQGDADQNDATHYVDITQFPHVVVERPTMPITQSTRQITVDGTDAVTLSGLPVPCDVTIGEDLSSPDSGNTCHVTDGILEWATLLPATYEIQVKAFPYIDWKGEVTAIAGSA